MCPLCIFKPGGYAVEGITNYYIQKKSGAVKKKYAFFDIAGK